MILKKNTSNHRKGYPQKNTSNHINCHTPQKGTHPITELVTNTQKVILEKKSIK